MTSKALTTVDPSTYAVVAQSEAMGALKDALSEGETLDFSMLPRIKMPAAGGQNWELPNGDAVKELQGVIMLRQPVRAFWAAEFESSGGGTPPDCHSTDNVNGIGLYGNFQGVMSATNPTGKCVTCPMDAWGSGHDNAKACRQLTRIFLLFPDSVLPTVVTLAPASFKAAQQYVVGLGAMGQRYHEVVTGIGLIKAQSKGGIAYSEAIFRTIAPIEGEALAGLRAYRASLLPNLQAAAADVSEG